MTEGHGLRRCQADAVRIIVVGAYPYEAGQSKQHGTEAQQDELSVKIRSSAKDRRHGSVSPLCLAALFQLCGIDFVPEFPVVAPRGRNAKRRRKAAAYVGEHGCGLAALRMN